MIFLLLFLPTILSLIFPKQLPLYLAIVLTMYSFYGYLWIDGHFLYNGTARWNSYELIIFTLFTAPIYIVTHIAFISMAWKDKEKRVIQVNIAGLLLCIIHIFAIFS